MKEEWKDIKGYEGIYQISNTGKIKSLNYRGNGIERMLQPTKNKDGYLQIKLYKNKKYILKTIHKLVAENFIDIPKLEVNHLNGIRDDNNVNNLEWCTHAENERYSWKTLGKKRESKHKNKIKRNLKPIIQYDEKHNYIKMWESASQAGKELKIRQNKISECCTGKRNTAGGFIWRFYKNNKGLNMEKKV